MALATHQGGEGEGDDGDEIFEQFMERFPNLPVMNLAFVNAIAAEQMNQDGGRRKGRRSRKHLKKSRKHLKNRRGTNRKYH